MVDELLPYYLFIFSDQLWKISLLNQLVKESTVSGAISEKQTLLFGLQRNQGYQGRESHSLQDALVTFMVKPGNLSNMGPSALKRLIECCNRHDI